MHSLATFLLLGCLSLTPVLSGPGNNKVFTNEQISTWNNDLMTKHSNCKSSVSQENAILFESSSSPNNPEKIRYRTCIAKSAGYIKNKEVDVRALVEDMKKYAQLDGVKILKIQTFLNLCKTRAEKTNTEEEVTDAFINCLLQAGKN